MSRAFRLLFPLALAPLALAVAGCSAGSLGPTGGGSSGGGSPGGGLSGGGPSGGGLSGGVFSGGAPRADLATQASCRDRVNEMYDRRNRADLYLPGSSVNTPFSANYQPGSTERGLSDRFDYDRTINECLRNSGVSGASGGGGTSPFPPPARGR